MPRFKIRDYANSISFNGTTSNLVKTTPTGINTGTGSRWAMGWVYLTSDALGCFVTFKVNSAQSPGFLLGQLAGTYYWALDSINAGNNLTMTKAQFQANFPLNKWIHITYICTTTTASLYVNGVVLMNAISWGTAINTGTYDALFIGKTQTSSQADLYPFSGVMKDAIVGNGTVTAQEILDNCYLGVVPSTAVSRFLMSEGSGTSIADSIGSNTMTATSITWSTNLPLGPKTAASNTFVERNANFSVYGTNSTTSGITIPNNAALNPTTAVTVACWIRADKENTYLSLFDNSQAGTTNSYFFDYFGGLGFRWYSVVGGTPRNITQTPSTRLDLGKWSFVTATYTGSAIYIYVNGSKLSEEITGISGALGTNSNQLCIFRPWNALATGMLTGNGYRPMIFNVGCTLAEHQDMYYKGVLSTALAAGKVLDLPMTEGSGTTLADISATGATATMGAAMTWDRVETPFKSAWTIPSQTNSLTFDGVDDAGSSGTTMNMQSKNKMTICTRIRLLATTGDKVIAEHTADSNFETAFLIATRSGGTGALDFTVHNSTTGSVYAGCRTPVLSTSNWYTIVWTWDGSLSSNEATVFIDGIETNVTRQLNGDVTNNLANGTLYLGGRAASSLFANFRMKDFTVYAGKIFTQKEVEDYTFRNTFPTLISGETRVVQYLFNEGSGITVAATGDATMNMTLVGTPAWSTNVPTALNRTLIT